MNCLSVVLFVIFVIREVYNYKCSVCVMQPLYTSPIKCPICYNHDERTAVADEKHFMNKCYGNHQCPPSYCSGPNNFTTCFVSANKCFHEKYRSFDGSCNNLKYPTLGASSTAFSRLLKPHYSNEDREYRLSKNKKPLPLPRNLSVHFFPDINNPDQVTLIAMEWGQILTHDIALSKPMEASVADCCKSKAPDTEKTCLLMKFPKNDYFYSKYNVTCSSKNRTTVTLVGNCEGNPREQVNGVTHNIDASIVYGSDKDTADSLRTFTKGELKVRQLKDGRVFLPTEPLNQAKVDCNLGNNTEPCYRAGDLRVNQNSQITSLQILLLREHNRLARNLKKLHPFWNDEKLYQEARAILIAQFQHISYNEFLELYIGKENMRRFDLYPRSFGYTRYCENVNHLTINSFTTGAFRIGHSGIQGHLSLVNYHFKKVKQIPIAPWMNRPLVVEQENHLDELLLGMVDQPMQVMENYLTTQMTNLMFCRFKDYGDDLVTLDIMRGRDHGMAPYVNYLEICTGFKAKTFDHLKEYMNEEFVTALSELYESIEDIDLYVGGTFEKLVPGTRLGPTFLCLVTEQFYRTKHGDRFWYEVGYQIHSFTPAQLKELRKSSFSRLLCDNGDNIRIIRKNSFLPESESNPQVNCTDIPSIDLSKWWL